MKPYGRRSLPVLERIFYYQLIRVRRIVENAFGKIQLPVNQGQEDSEECFWHIVQQIRLPLDHPQTVTSGGNRRYPVLHLST